MPDMTTYKANDIIPVGFPFTDQINFTLTLFYTGKQLRGPHAYLIC